ncbi:MAG TPA: polysaccharide deacetylase family protein [Planctomycetota bacterium]|nr:polysaccharide deacetylase family protein [Planctomycetota bacterium]
MLLALMAAAALQDGNRLVYLDEGDPYYVHRGFARLTTLQWVGEPGVEAVVTLGIDDMRDSAKYEAFLRPILDRLKAIDGRAPVSIMANRVVPADEQLQRWLQEGLSLECHTYDHPCPLLKDKDFAKAKTTYDRCVDLLAEVPSNRPVAFRMPCCDSLNTPSPRFWAEIFNRTTPAGRFLAIDTSVFNITTPKDASLPREIPLEPDGRERFRKYLPFPSFVNTIEDYPYPYVIGRLCWEFPCAVPSDWEAQNLHKPNNPDTVRDWLHLVDATVLKRGVFNLVFHPHNWIKNTQVVEFIDRVVEKHGAKVKFLTFRECLERLERHALGGHPLRRPDGGDNGVRLLDVNADGYMDVVVANEKAWTTRVWSPADGAWKEVPFPSAPNATYGVVGNSTVALSAGGAWRFDGGEWRPSRLLEGLPWKGPGRRLRDVDGDGTCEAIINREIWRWSTAGWEKLPYALPGPIETPAGADTGLRFVDLNADGKDDVVISNDDGWLVAVFKGGGWDVVSHGKPGDAGALPRIVRGTASNGAWFHSNHLWIQNEDTASLKDLVDRRSFADLLRKP